MLLKEILSQFWAYELKTYLFCHLSLFIPFNTSMIKINVWAATEQKNCQLSIAQLLET